MISNATVNICIYDKEVIDYVQQLIAEGQAKEQKQGMLTNRYEEKLFFQDDCMIVQIWMENAWSFMHYFEFEDGDFDPVFNYDCGYNSTKQHEDYLHALESAGFHLACSFFKDAGGLYKLYDKAVEKKHVEIEYCPDGFEFHGLVEPKTFWIKDKKLFYYKGSTGVTVKIPENVVEICNDAFTVKKKREHTAWNKETERLSRISQITFPKGLQKIGDRAFLKCDLEGELVLPDALIRIGDSAFEGCRLQKIVIGDKIKKIGKSAFSNMNTLETVVISSATVKIGAKAFEGCSALTICAPAGSYAETYAKENGIPFLAK